MLEIIYDFTLYAIEYITIILTGLGFAWLLLHHLRYKGYSTRKKIYTIVSIILISTFLLILFVCNLNFFEPITGYYVEWYIIFIASLMIFSSKKMQNMNLKEFIKLMKK